MKVRALTSFHSETGSHSSGDEFEMRDDLAAIRIESGLVAPVKKEVRTATVPDAEEAVAHRGKR